MRLGLWQAGRDLPSSCYYRTGDIFSHVQAPWDNNSGILRPVVWVTWVAGDPETALVITFTLTLMYTGDL